MADELLEHIAIGCNAVGKRIAGDLHDSAMHRIGLRRLLDPSGFEVLDIAALGARESIEDVGDEIGMRCDQRVLDDHRVIDRVVAALAQRRKAGFQCIGDERLHVGRIHLDADRGGELAG